jgi:hypothetical protein
MDRRTRTSFAAGLALALAGCSTATPSQPATASPSAAAAQTLTPPTAAPSPTQITGLAGTIAYNRNLVEGDFQGAYRLFTMPAAGGEGVQLLDGEAEQARWSADGTRLSVAVEGLTGRITVGFVDRDGSNFHRLHSKDVELGCAEWSRDESTFACEGWDDQTPGRTGLYTMAADGTGLARVTTAPDGRQDAPCDFSPDGEQIAFIRINLADEDSTELMIVNRDGSGEHKLIDNVVMLGCGWSRDGSKLLITSAYGILVVDMTASEPTATVLPLAVPAGARLSHPAWSFDGRYVVLSVALTRQPNDIWVANADGSGATQLTNTPRIDEEVESWGP